MADRPGVPAHPACTRTRRGLAGSRARAPALAFGKVLRLPETLHCADRHHFEDSHLALHLWLQAIYMMCSSKKGVSTRQLQRTLGVGMKTAWHLGHRIRLVMDDSGSGQIGGGKTVEADETFSRKLWAGKKNKAATRTKSRC